MAAWRWVAAVGRGRKLWLRRAAFYLLSSGVVAAGRILGSLVADPRRSSRTLLHRILRGWWRNVHARPQISFAAARAGRSGLVCDQSLSPDHRVLGFSRCRNARERGVPGGNLVRVALRKRFAGLIGTGDCGRRGLADECPRRGDADVHA